MLLFFRSSVCFQTYYGEMWLYKPGSARYNDIAPVTRYSCGHKGYCTARDITFVGEGLMGKQNP